MTRPRVKICCIANIVEARLAIKHGTSALGLVSEMPSGPGVIDEKLIAEIVAQVPPPIATFLLTSKTTAEEIIGQQRRARANTIQICDRIALEEYDVMRAAMPGVSLVQVVHVTGTESFDEAMRVAVKVDALLLDSGNQSLPVKELGGTGRTHNWTISRSICKSSPKPAFLAGGLKAENVIEAIQNVRPFGLDICSGVRTNGKLDEEKLERFFHSIEDFVSNSRG
jgi:phosphoribosylanthranilate isomerase